jgi:hypothetical protein
MSTNDSKEPLRVVVTRIDANICSLLKTREDHEKRIRETERNQWTFVGIFTAVLTWFKLSR